MIPRPAPRLWACWMLLVVAATSSAQSKAPRPRPYLITNVKTSTDEGAEAKHLVLRDGRIEAILPADATLPAGHWTLDGTGLVATPAFVDAYSRAGCDTPQPVAEQDRPVDQGANVFIDMREANRKGIQPAFSAAEVFELDAKGSEAFQKGGFGLILSAPGGELLAGRSAVATTRDAARRQRIVRGEVFDHASFRANGGGYPSTLMGFHAQLRQFFLDTQRHGVLKQRFERGVPGSRPIHDVGLDAGLEILAGERRLVCEANSVKDIRRWIRLADELGLNIAISGGREAHEVADVLASRGIPVFLTLDWGDEVEDPDAEEEEKEEEKEEEEEKEIEQAEETEADAEAEPEPDWDYEEPLGVRRERRQRWVELRDGARILADAGVRFAFGTGDRKSSELMKAVRTLVEEGFPRDTALTALTRGGAELLGVGGAYGRLEPGYSASLALWTDDPLKDKAQVRWMVLDGFPQEFEVKESKGKGGGPAEKPADGFTVAGRWELSVDSSEDPMVLELSMDEEGAVSGTVTFTNPILGDEQQTEDVSGQVSDKSVSLESSFSVNEFSITWNLEGEFSGKDAFNGEVSVSGPGFEDTNDCAAFRLPERSSHTALSLGTMLSGRVLEAGAPTVPFQPRRSLQPICGCNKHHDHFGNHDDDGDDDQ